MVDTKIFDEILELLQADMPPEKTYETVCALVKQAVSYKSATLFMYDKETQKTNPVYQSGKEVVDLMSQFNFGPGTGLSGWMLEQKNPVILPSLAKSRAGKEGRFQSFASLPLRIGERLIGVLNLGHSEPDVFKKDDIPAFSIIGTQISLVLEQIQLRQELALKNKELQKTLVELKAAQKELVEKERLAAIGEIVVTVNHEINNPLASIMGLTEILSMSIHTLPPKKISESLKMIIKESQRIQKVTRKLTEIRTSTPNKYIDGVKMTVIPE